MEKRLVYNSVVCLICGEHLVSRHRHDFQRCSCENGAVCDGGLEYERFGAKDLEAIQSFCVYDDEPHEVIRFYVERGSRGKNMDEELKYIKLKDVDDDHLKAIIKYEEEIRPNNRFLKIYKTEVKYRKKNK